MEFFLNYMKMTKAHNIVIYLSSYITRRVRIKRINDMLQLLLS